MHVFDFFNLLFFFSKCYEMGKGLLHALRH
ncbi:Uncharacterised protein [Klebsiella pneumoniae]|nr:Uncharacterised protein [Klebsiella pneumoniae]VTT31062.1 Uncharacterised protein [Klebsiella pneumoniae]